MRRQLNVDARGSRRIGISGEDVNRSCEIEVRAQKAAFGQKSTRHLSPARTAALWLTAAFVAAMWTPEARANDFGSSGAASVRLAQTSTSDPSDPQDTGRGEHQRAEWLARELASTQRDLDVLLKLLNRACDESTSTRQAADRETAELRKALQEERDRAAAMERDLAAMRQSGQPQKAPATGGEQVTSSKQTSDTGSAELRKSLQQERDRAGRLEQDLAAARRDVETQTALAAKAGADASDLKKTADAGSVDLRKSLQQERDRAGRLEQDLAAARRDVETQTALAAKAGADASDLKKTADAGSADLQKSVQDEHERASRLEQDLAAARRDIETQTALATKAEAETKQLKKTADARAADLQKSVQQEHERESKLEQNLAAARRDVETQTALAAKAGAETKQLKKTTDARAADLRKSLQQEHDRAGGLERDVAAARLDVETQTALATEATAEASRLKQAAVDDSAELKRSLQEAHDRAGSLATDVSMVHSAVYAYEAQTRTASDQAAGFGRAAEGSAAELRIFLVQEWEREARLQRDLAAAQREVAAQTALVAKARDEANQKKGVRVRKLLQQERDRASRLEQDLAAARRDLETQTALAVKANDEAAQAKRTTESGSAELRQLERDLAWARSNTPAPSIIAVGQTNTQRWTEAAKPVAVEQVALADTRAEAQPKADDAGEVARLMAYARVLLGRGDISSAQIVLRRAAQMGDAHANFALAETYDPLVLSKWGTHGTHGDAKKALDFYARALAGGVKEARTRSDALRR
jgi:hypothetical protein